MNHNEIVQRVIDDLHSYEEVSKVEQINEGSKIDSLSCVDLVVYLKGRPPEKLQVVTKHALYLPGKSQVIVWVDGKKIEYERISPSNANYTKFTWDKNPKHHTFTIKPTGTIPTILIR
tara:strand:+ start:1653 stop:2006 length:354 start_codon:yes stop_codon:yes gene_type:complete